MDANNLRKPTVIIGDFNIDWSGNSQNKENLETLMRLHQYEQLVKEYTRCFKNSKTTIDLIFTNAQSLVPEHKVIKSDISDHFAIQLKVNLKRPKAGFSYVTKRDFKKFDEVEFFNSARCFDFSTVEDVHCVHKAAEILESKIEILVEQFAPFKTQRLKQKNNLCWKCPVASKLSRLKKDAFQKFIDTGFDKTSTAWEDYRLIRNKASNAVRDAKKRAMRAVLNDKTLDQWQKIKIFQGKNYQGNNGIQEIESDGSTTSESPEIAECLNRYFSSIGINLNEEAKLLSNNSFLGFDNEQAFSFPKFTFQEVSSSEVSKYLHSLKSRKTGGTNQIPAFIYQILEPFILNPLTHIINLSLISHEFPDVWKKALVIPIFKSGKKSLPNNYRPISLLPILSKVLEKILNYQIRDYLEINDLIASRQFGFRSGTSTDQILTQLVNKIRSLMSKPESKFVTLSALDIRKAFDCVNHEILVSKLVANFNFQSDASNLIKNYLFSREQAMKVNGCVSKFSQIKTGVPQGSVLGPLLFIMFINDLMELKNCYLYADDCLLVTSGENPDISTKLMEKSIHQASSWYSENCLVLNSDKTDVMTISNNQNTKPPDLKFNNLTFKQSNKIKYLGVILDNQLNFKPHTSKIKQKLYPIVTNFQRNRKFLTPSLATLWYIGLIRSNLEYSSPVLFTTNDYVKKEFLKIENRCLKIIDFDSSKENTRKAHNIPALTLRFEYLYLLTFYKIVNNLVPVIDSSLLPEKLTSETRLAKSSGFRLSKENFRFALANFGAKKFNELPNHVKLSQSVLSFKNAARSHILKLPQLN